MAAMTTAAIPATRSFQKQEEEWRAVLSPEQFRVLRLKGTDKRGKGEYTKKFEEGTYSCAGCGTALYKSTTKFDSGCGWPAFFDAIPGAIKQTPEAGGRRMEITCAVCDGHLGHVFKGEGYSTPTDQRHCELAASFSHQSRLCFGGFNDLTDLEATCVVALFHLESGLDVGVPFLHVEEIFNIAPWIQDVFQTRITPCVWIFFHPPPKMYKTFQNEDIKWKAQPVRMLKLKGSVEEVKLTTFKLKISKLPWNLYLFQYKEDSSLYCLTLGGSNERPLTRKPKSILFKS
ncbi:unnamed protein product [Arabidopsis lyrata]|nr:unnamed protein product [Arabidopsis lyrata]